MKTPKVRMKTEYWNEKDQTVWQERMNKRNIVNAMILMFLTAMEIMSNDKTMTIILLMTYILSLIPVLNYVMWRKETRK